MSRLKKRILVHNDPLTVSDLSGFKPRRQQEQPSSRPGLMELLRPARQSMGILKIAKMDGIYSFFSKNTGFRNDFHEDGKIRTAP
jgi:hypothetical protein